MAWKAVLPDGTLSEPFDTAAEAEAFAEEITAAGGVTPEEIWGAATSPRVDRATFMRRTAMGWKAHRALHTAPDGRYLGVAGTRPTSREHLVEKMGGRDAVMYEAYGRTRTLRQWSESCGISTDVLRKGAKRMGSLGAYLEHRGWYPTKPAVPGDPEMSDDRWSTP